MVLDMEIVNNINNYFSYNSVVIISYFVICLIILILNYITKDNLNRFLMLKRGPIINPMTYIRLFTSSCCHEGWSHFKNNFLIILIVGPMLEEKYGSIALLKMMLITCICTGIIHLVISKRPAIGASNITFMFIALSSVVNISEGKVPITLLLVFLFYVVDEIIKAITRSKDNIGHDAHIMGAICGFIFGYFGIPF